MAKRWRTRAAHWIADHPRSLPGRLAALRFGLPTRGAAVIEPGDRPIRVLIAPANYAGQAHAWCTMLEATDPTLSARNLAIEAGVFHYESDLIVPPAIYHNSRRWQRAQFAATRQFTHLLVESFIPPFGRLFGRDLELQLQALGAGVDIAFMCHGTDVRRPSLSRERTSLSPFHALDDATSARLEQLAVRNIELLKRANRPVFVSTPDLLDDVPGAAWCPVVVEPGRWSGPRRPSTGPLRVIHAPSKAATKGTALIEPVLERLAAAGRVDYTALRGIPNERMPEALAAADVVVDQFSVGIYGVAACEAMAAGCVVVSHVTERVRELVRDRTGLHLPIVEAGPQTLESVLIQLAEDPDRREALRRDGSAFVSAVHDGRRSVEALRNAWIAPPRPRATN